MAFWSTNSFMENAYFIVGVLQFVSIIVAIGIFFHQRDKDQQEDKTLRFKIAHDLCKEYIGIYHKEYRDIYLKHRENPDDHNLKAEAVHLLNKIDVWAIAFAQGHADSDLGREMVGGFLVNHSAQLKTISGKSSDDYKREYKAICDLASKWS